jgi:hypothetical protein
VIAPALNGRGHEVSYGIETTNGTTPVVTYTYTEGGLAAHRPDTMGATASTPWSTTVTFEEPASLISVATDSGGPTGTGTCRIFVDGDEVAEASGIGGAVCEAVVP